MLLTLGVSLVLLLSLLGWMLIQAPRVGPPPSFESVRAAWRASDARLLDRHGEVLQVLRVDFGERRAPWVALDAVSPALVEAVLRAEDRRFHQHAGVDFRALGAALRDRLVEGRRRGASTLAMQLAAELHPAFRPGPGGRSLAQKLGQMLAAWRLQAAWGRARVLEAYLNRAPSRGELRGVGALALGLFAKQPEGLDAEEAAVVAALLAAPSASPARVLDRACLLLGQKGDASMFAHEKRHVRFSPGAADCPAALGARFAAALQAPRARWPAPTLAPHLARRLLREAGEARATTLDAAVQRIALGALRARLADLAGRNVRDGAALVVDNATGEVLAWVGSGGPASRAPAVDGVLARRQAGSTLKPFLYALALERRLLTAASLLDDSPLALDTGAGLYAPQNYERDYKGRVSVRSALAASLNVPAVKTLELVGVPAFHGLLGRLGYQSLEPDPDHYGWSLALGSADVSLLEQVTAYRALARLGRAGPLRWLPEVGGAPAPDASDAARAPNAAGPGEPSAVLAPAAAPGEPPTVLAPAAAWLVADILADRGSRGLSFGLASPLATRFWSAVKTGTSKDLRDNWCIGFSDRYTVGVWTGNFEGDAMQGVSGVSGAAPAWLDIMTALHAARPSQAPTPPDGLEAMTVRFAEALEPPRQEWFLTGTASAEVRGLDPSHQPPTIVSPADGVIIALDPDIPPGHEAVALVARPARPDLRWRLNGELLDGGPTLHWPPRRGRHRLQLEDGAGRPLASVGFEVR